MTQDVDDQNVEEYKSLADYELDDELGDDDEAEITDD